MKQATTFGIFGSVPETRTEGRSRRTEGRSRRTEGRRLVRFGLRDGGVRECGTAA